MIKFSSLISPDSASLSFPDNTRFLSQERIVRITRDNLSALKIYLRDAQSDDPYLLSVAYFATTGRKGLWIYRGDESIIIFCRHPNVEGKHLIFPPIPLPGKKRTLSDLGVFIKDHGSRMGQFQLFRFCGTQAHEATEMLNTLDLPWTFAQRPETVLDTLYPSHIVAARSLAAPDNPDMRYFRRRIKRIDDHKIGIYDLRHPAVPQMANTIFAHWGIEESDYASYLLRLPATSTNMNGLCLTYEKAPAAIALWDVTNNIANALVAIADTDISGMSAYLYHQIGRQLENDGVPFLCLGGSEEEGLDFFKMKMAPVQSVSLCSVQAEIREAPILRAGRRHAA